MFQIFGEYKNHEQEQSLEQPTERLIKLSDSTQNQLTFFMFDDQKFPLKISGK